MNSLSGVNKDKDNNNNIVNLRRSSTGGTGTSSSSTATSSSSNNNNIGITIKSNNNSNNNNNNNNKENNYSTSPPGNKVISPMSSPNSLQSGATPTIAQLQSLVKQQQLQKPTQQQQQQQQVHQVHHRPTLSLDPSLDDLKSKLQHTNIDFSSYDQSGNGVDDIEEVSDEVIINHDYHSSDDEDDDLDEDDEELELEDDNNNNNNNSVNNNKNGKSISNANSCESIAEEEELTASPKQQSRQYSYTIGAKIDDIQGRSNRSESTVVHHDIDQTSSDKVINAKDKISSDYKKMMEDLEGFRNEKLKQRKSKFFTKKDLEEIPFNPSSGTQLRSTLFRQFMNEKITMISENPEKYKSELMKCYKENLKPAPKSPTSSQHASNNQNHQISTQTDKLKALHRTRSVSQPPVVTSNNKTAIGSLETIIEKEKKRDGNTERILPILFIKCIDFLSKEEALKTEGLFRVAGNSSEIEDLMKSILLYGSDIPTNCCYHVVSNMLKKFLRQLSTPVFTFKYHNDFIQATKLPNDEERIKVIKETLKLLPNVNQILIKELMKFLSSVTNYSNVNMMHAHNLGLMFGPNMLKPPTDAEMNAISMLDAGNQVITLLIENYDIFYNDQ